MKGGEPELPNWWIAPQKANQHLKISLIFKLLRIMGWICLPRVMWNLRKGHDLCYAINDSRLLWPSFRETIDFAGGIEQTTERYKSNHGMWKDLN
jgi:hypothetical protein